LLLLAGAGTIAYWGYKTNRAALMESKPIRGKLLPVDTKPDPSLTILYHFFDSSNPLHVEFNQEMR